MLLRDWSTSLITPVGNVRPPKAAGGRQLCPKDLVDNDSLWRRGKKTNKHFDSCYLQGTANIRHKGWCIMRKKNWKPYKLSHRASGSGPPGRPTGVVTGYCSNQRTWRTCDIVGSDCFCCKLDPSSSTRDIGLLWATDWRWRARNREEGAEK